MIGNISFAPFTLCCGDRLVEFCRPAVMGILNATADSFYDGGRYVSERQIVERAINIDAEGADIIDIGVVSTRPGATMLTPDEEALRLSKVVAMVRRELPQSVISVDTCYSLPARAAVESGADIINDIGGGDFDNDMFSTVAELRTPYILMHNPHGSPDNPAGVGTSDPSPVVSMAKGFSAKLRKLYDLGVRDVVIDPGFGFSKTLDDNYVLMSHIDELRRLFPNNPLLVALSRKSMIYKLLGTTPDDALVGTVALHTVALLAGAQMLRAHDVRATRQTIDVVGKM